MPSNVPELKLALLPAGGYIGLTQARLGYWAATKVFNKQFIAHAVIHTGICM